MTTKELINDYYEKIPELLGQPKVSFLIGAGCSACAGLPFMNELTSQIFDRLDPTKTKNKDEKMAYRLLNEVRKSFDGLDNVSIEDYLSEIQDIDAILQRQNKKGVATPFYRLNSGKYGLVHTQILLRNVKKTIRDILGGKITTIKFHRQFCNSIHNGLIKGRKRTKHPVNYFILNYDTLFEDALALEEIIFTDGFVGGATAWWNPSCFRKEIMNLDEGSLQARVYKLHGSIDWIRPEKSDFPVRVRATLPGNEVIGEGEPVVIYPSSIKYKETQYDPYAQMMSSLRKHLTTAENHVLSIIGYGFNDEHINIEIRDAIKNSSGALSVLIFMGSKELPETLKAWIKDIDICSQILILGKNGIWKDGNQILESDDDIKWYKFEFISDLVSGVK